MLAVLRGDPRHVVCQHAGLASPHSTLDAFSLLPTRRDRLLDDIFRAVGTAKVGGFSPSPMTAALSDRHEHRRLLRALCPRHLQLAWCSPTQKQAARLYRDLREE